MLENLFWDTCVFIRYLANDKNEDRFADIAQLVADAKAGERKIYYSTMTLAEIMPKHILPSAFGTIQDFLDEMGGACVGIDPNPNIMMATAELRSAQSVNPSNPALGRPIATPDAIILMSCVALRDDFGVQDIVLQSTDEGKNKNWFGKSVPVVGFDRWFPPISRTPTVAKVCSLPIEKPSHPHPKMVGL